MTDIIKLLPAWLLYGYIFLFGICIGSFLNVMILRGLSGEDIVFGRSHCPKCKNNLKWYMNIPLFSYMFLRGRCAFCKTKISIQYPVVEFLNGIFYVFSFLAFGFTLKAFLICIIISLFITLATTDILETVIIDWHSFLLFGVCLLTAKVLGFSLVGAFFASFLVFILFEYLSLFCLSMIGTRCFGFGDSLILLGISALFGLKNIPVLIFLSFIVQMVFSLIPIFKAKKYRLFSLMTSVLVIFLINLAFLYNNFQHYEAVFNISILIMLVVLILSILDIFKKTQTPEPVRENEISFIDFSKIILRTIFIIPYLAKQLFKKGTKQASLAYFLFIPVLICLGVFEYIGKFKIFAYGCALLLLYFTFAISINEEKTQDIIFKDNLKYIKEEYEQIEVSEPDFTLLPFGPALVVSSLLCIFYMDEIKIFLKVVYENYLNLIINNF